MVREHVISGSPVSGAWPAQHAAPPLHSRCPLPAPAPTAGSGGRMKHLPLPIGEAPLPFPEHQPLNHTCHLVQIPALHPQQIFPVPLVPVAALLHRQRRDSGNQGFRLRPLDDRADSNRLAVGGGDLQQQSTHRHFEHIVVLCTPRDLFLNDGVDHAGPMHWMNDQIPNAEHGKLLPISAGR